ncbi:hypothetical protein BIFADO_00001 [Bifidobacterium adolescentis L2-32]|uniref:Uncharacterized protein n=1 Tax=Bifidobacterium adolescentis L2-32 TaxID=411481 RepID=A7A2H4_BIFAD|nr:hypothetical protein BIFADO_00001 [Bifidobacterium adolescentis L2-32]
MLKPPLAARLQGVIAESNKKGHPTLQDGPPYKNNRPQASLP